MLSAAVVIGALRIKLVSIFYNFIKKSASSAKIT